MEASLHYLLMATHSVLQKKLFLSLKESGLTLGQPKVLDYLKDHNGASQKDIALACHIEPASLTSILGRMEEKGMIARKMLNGNRRSLYVFLTEKGRLLQQAVEKNFLSLEEKAFQGFSERERALLVKQLGQIYENLTEE